jgi:hypothetical protein
VSTVKDPVRVMLARLLSWRDAHVDFDTAIADLPAALRGVQPAPEGTFAAQARQLLADVTTALESPPTP